MLANKCKRTEDCSIKTGGRNVFRKRVKKFMAGLVYMLLSRFRAHESKLRLVGALQITNVIPISSVNRSIAMRLHGRMID